MKMFIDGRWTTVRMEPFLPSSTRHGSRCRHRSRSDRTGRGPRHCPGCGGTERMGTTFLFTKNFPFRALLCPADGKYMKKSRPSCVKKAVSPLNSAARKLPPTLRSFAFIVLPHIPFTGSRSHTMPSLAPRGTWLLPSTSHWAYLPI